MQARVTRRIASVGSTSAASGTFSTRTSPAAYMTVALMPPRKHRSGRGQRPCEGNPPRVPQGAMRGSSLLTVDTRSEIRDFLATRRARLKAADVGLPDYGPR